MNRTKLKNYAPQARRDFIQAMTDRAAYFGLTETKIEPVVEKGDVAVIGGRSHPRAAAKKRKSLEDRIKRHGFEPTMEAMAYTWFNRLVAIRFMERHGYLEHGYRVLSHPEGKPTPEILEHAEHVDLPGLKKEAVIDLKLAGNKESELYRLLLTAQCNALHTAMPFLFEKIDDETELLLPDNLLHSDSLIRKLVGEIDEDDWQEVEIIGWLYQFYISEKKDEVIGKVVASEDIPAATQLFTPNWIVKYLVQNTLGRQWLATYPQSALRQQMQYYIEPAEQPPEVQEQLKAITPTSLNPEELTLLDPACGSGHILVEAYDLFKAIYQERGYRAKDIPALILQKNLFGLEIDDRAAQLAAFALMMKARADDRRIFDSEAKPNVVALQDSQGMNAADLTLSLNAPVSKEDVPTEYLFEEIQEEKDGLFSKKALAEKGHVSQGDIASLLALFENAKTFGSLIQVPPKLAAKLPEIEKRLDDVLKYGDLTHASAHVLKPLLLQARLLSRQYDAVVANPPYMGSKAFSSSLKQYVNQEYKDAKADLYACFIQRNLRYAKQNAFVGMITIPNWMFLSSFESGRLSLLGSDVIDSFIHNGRGVFGADFGSCSFVLRRSALPRYLGVFRKLFEKQGSVSDNDVLEGRFFTSPTFTACSEDFAAIPGSPIVFWVGHSIRTAYRTMPLLRELVDSRVGMATGNNDRFVRIWSEVAFATIGFGLSRQDAAESGLKWFPYANGGGLRKWYGNHQHVVNWQYDGKVLQSEMTEDNTRLRAHNFNLDRIFSAGATWTSISSSFFGVRVLPPGFLFSSGSNSLFADAHIHEAILGFLNSRIAVHLLGCVNPTVNANPGDTELLPFGCESAFLDKVSANVKRLVELAKSDWDTQETSWDFRTLPIIQHKTDKVQQSLEATRSAHELALGQVKQLEKENNELFVMEYGLSGEVATDVPEQQITMYRCDQEEEIKRLLSYAVGCIMGRYSLDKPGLVYAQAGNEGFDIGNYKTHRADDDGIIPVLETDWGIRDDATNRVVEFVGVAWPRQHLEENLKFIAENLGPDDGEQPRDTIRRYLATGFFKHHLRSKPAERNGAVLLPMYRNRPIYWLFSSGKQRAFQCLVYLHRYHEGTLARMRTEYVIPLQGQIAARIEQLEGDKAKATSTSHRNKLQKQQNDLKKQEAELRTFEEKLKHAADQKISLDLDDGVKVNYAKFGDLLAESKAITGGKDEE